MIVYHVCYRDDCNYRILETFNCEIDAVAYLDKLARKGTPDNIDLKHIHIEKVFDYKGEPSIRLATYREMG